MSDSPARPTFSSAFAAVCATAGVAIGLGNIWRFPYMMGKYGGAAFLLLYLVIVAALGDGLGWSRRRALIAVGLSQIALSVPALVVDGYIGLSDLIWGTTMQPVGAVIAVIALAWCIGTRKALEEMRRNSRLPVPVWLFHWIKYGIPVGIVGTLVYGWVSR